MSREPAEAESSDVEAELHHVAVLSDVVLAFDAHLAHILGCIPGTELEELATLDDLGPDEAALEVAVDPTGTHGCS